MSVLSGDLIKELVRNKELSIEPFHEDGLQPASYDARVGNRILVSPIKEEIEGGIIDLRQEKDNQYLVLPGQFILVLTKERFVLPPFICGRCGVRSFWQRKGVISLGGVQIDPGWQGHLVIPLVNVGPEPVPIRLGEKIFTIEFERLEAPTSQPYGSNPAEHIYLNQEDFPVDTVNFFLKAKNVILLTEIPFLRERLSNLELQLNEIIKEIEPRRIKGDITFPFGLTIFGFFLILGIALLSPFGVWALVACLAVAMSGLLGGFSYYFAKRSLKK